MTPAPVAGTLTVGVPMFRLARGLRLSSFRFFPAVDAAVTAFRAGTGADWTPAVQPEAGPAAAGPTART